MSIFSKKKKFLKFEIIKRAKKDIPRHYDHYNMSSEDLVLKKQFSLDFPEFFDVEVFCDGDLLNQRWNSVIKENRVISEHLFNDTAMKSLKEKEIFHQFFDKNLVFMESGQFNLPVAFPQYFNYSQNDKLTFQLKKVTNSIFNNEIDKPFKCDKKNCFAQYKTRPGLKYHMRKKHFCNIC